jgi:transcriptional regulator with XRE-family HTH domain/KaiC/GvpD/RAD55 family RecA-like ATPase
MKIEKSRVVTGIDHLDQLIDGLYVGDNVVWYDDAGSLAPVFYLNFILASQANSRPLIYVSFDRSPKNLLDKLGSLANNNHLTILDCFTYGKGSGSEVFLRFYDDGQPDQTCQIIRIEDPHNDHHVMEAVYNAHAQFEGDVRLIFESLTGMQELWGGEDHIINFYSHSCPRLYELSTVAYWIIEKRAHSQRLRARINQVAQVAIDLSVKRGKTSLTVLKAENRDLETLNKPYQYWSKGLDVMFDSDPRTSGRIDLGIRLKELRIRQGLSQTELAKLVGVTPSTISQIESCLIYPSLPALFKMAEALNVNVGHVFTEPPDRPTYPFIFPSSETRQVKLANLPKDHIIVKSLMTSERVARSEPFLIEIPGKTNLSGHFFNHKGDEFGYLLNGELQVKMGATFQKVTTGDVVYLTTEVPVQWENTKSKSAHLIWLLIK